MDAGGHAGGLDPQDANKTALSFGQGVLRVGRCYVQPSLTTSRGTSTPDRPGSRPSAAGAGMKFRGAGLHTGGQQDCHLWPSVLSSSRLV